MKARATFSGRLAHPLPDATVYGKWTAERTPKLPTNCGTREKTIRGAHGGIIEAPSALSGLESTAAAEAIFSGTRKDCAYARFGNPTADRFRDLEPAAR